MYTLLITPAELQRLLASDTPPVVIDCSFDLMKPDSADALFEAQHIPGALHAHLERDLSAHGTQPAVNGGRHPLPRREDFARRLGQWGIGPQTQVVVLDRNQGNYCGRLWWMLKWLGHDAVAMLDGGLQGWLQAGGPVSSDASTPPVACDFVVRPALRTLVLQDAVVSRLGQDAQTLVDARGAPRYRGEVEPLDPIAGHIPGALNRPYTDNFNPDGRFKAAEVLRAEWLALLDGRDARQVVHHCGSGVSAVPNLIAMELAGLGNTALYAGSWSEWSRSPGLPCARGAEPGTP